MEKSEFKSLSLKETLTFFKTYIQPIEDTRVIPISEALGYVLAEDVVCPLDIPQFNNSAMDGWAFSSKAVVSGQKFTLTEIGSSFAGHPFEGALKDNECIRIMTGGKVPDEADTVVMQEQVDAQGNQITFPDDVRPGQNVRLRAEEFHQGATCLQKGTRLRAPHISFLASLGIAEVCVFRKLRVAFFSTGDELRPIGEPLPEGCIYDSNRYAIEAMLKESGFETVNLGIVKDNPEALKEVLRQAADRADAVITSGGVSVGKADFSRVCVEEIGSLVDWHCRIKPGKPLAIGKIDNAYFFGLPGNPTAAQITFFTIVKAALKRLANQEPYELPILSATTLDNIKKKPGHVEFQRGILEFNGTKGTVRLAGSQKTGATASMIKSNCFIYLSDESSSLVPGDETLVIPYHGIFSA